jgi:hypothetical protein
VHHLEIIKGMFSFNASPDNIYKNSALRQKRNSGSKHLVLKGFKKFFPWGSGQCFRYGMPIAANDHSGFFNLSGII